MGDTTAVDSYPAGASPYGAMNMAGNVYEWVNDWLDGSYYSYSPASNPTGPVTGTFGMRVYRGGCWGYTDGPLRAASRSAEYPYFRSYYSGFRCARYTDAPPEPSSILGLFNAAAIAFGNIDNDPADEIGYVAFGYRDPISPQGNVEIWDDANHRFLHLKRIGDIWGSDAYGTSIAFGDVDGDGMDEVGYVRKADMNARLEILDDANHRFASLKQVGDEWGADAYGTSIAFGKAARATRAVSSGTGGIGLGLSDIVSLRAGRKGVDDRYQWG